MRTRNLLKATPRAPFQVGHSKTPKCNQTALAHRDRARSTPADDSLEKTNLFFTPT
jgi:hypothetical protein